MDLLYASYVWEKTETNKLIRSLMMNFTYFTLSMLLFALTVDYLGRVQDKKRGRGGFVCHFKKSVKPI